jgi:hypothetical protein
MRVGLLWSKSNREGLILNRTIEIAKRQPHIAAIAQGRCILRGLLQHPIP